MSTFSNVGPFETAKKEQIRVDIPPVSLIAPPIDWQPLLDAMAASQERGEYRNNEILSAIHDVCGSLSLPVPQITVSPEVKAPEVYVNSEAPQVTVSPQIIVPPDNVTITWPSSLLATSLLNALALLLLSAIAGVQLYLSVHQP